MSETKPSVTLDGEGGGCCACISVKYSPVSAGEMTQEQWMCQECGTEFVKKFWLDKALTELKRIKEAEKCPECDGTGYYGDNGPGIKGNQEYQECDYCEGTGKRIKEATRKAERDGPELYADFLEHEADAREAGGNSGTMEYEAAALLRSQAAEIVELKALLRDMEFLLTLVRDISGPFSRDPEQHMRNIIEDHAAQAEPLLSKLKARLSDE